MTRSSPLRLCASVSTLCLGLLLAGCGDATDPATKSPSARSEASTDAGQGEAMHATPAEEIPAAPPAEAPEQPAPSPTSLPLTPGVYVAPGENCANPANAGFRIYDGRGISGSATRECRAAVRSKDGDVYRVDQSCVDTYSDKRTTVAQTIRAPNARSFTLTEAGGSATTFRLCPAGEAPPYLQDMAKAK